jgi:hypothetical protein
VEVDRLLEVRVHHCGRVGRVRRVGQTNPTYQTASRAKL